MTDYTTILVRIDDEHSRTNVCVVPTLEQALVLAEQLNVIAKEAPAIWTKAYDLYHSRLDTGDRAYRHTHKEDLDATMKVEHDKIRALVGELMDPELLCNPYATMTFGVEQIRTLGE